MAGSCSNYPGADAGLVAKRMIQKLLEIKHGSLLLQAAVTKNMKEKNLLKIIINRSNNSSKKNRIL